MFKILVLACIAALTLAIPDQAQLRSMEAAGAGSSVESFVERLFGRLVEARALSCPASGSLLSAAEKDEFLTAHNKFRSQEPSAMGSLTWNDALAKRAQDLVDSQPNCNMAHKEMKCGSAQMGQNLAWDWASRAPTGNMPGNKVVGLWHSEIKDYDYDSNSCSKVCGHYTQVVWETTKEVGCAARVCGNSRLVACDYYPPGNYLGQKPYQLVEGSSSSSSSVEWSCISNMKIKGYNVGGDTYGTVKDCQIRCSQSADCQSIDFNVVKEKCHLNSVTAAEAPADNVITFTVDDKKDWQYCERGVFCEEGMAIKLFNNKVVPDVATRDLCVALCRDETEFACRSVDYQREDHACKMSVKNRETAGDAYTSDYPEHDYCELLV